MQAPKNGFFYVVDREFVVILASVGAHTGCSPRRETIVSLNYRVLQYLLEF
jgi:hypothetical protein